MKCKYCGSPLSGDETLCPTCGQPLDAVTEDILAAEEESSSVAADKQDDLISDETTEASMGDEQETSFEIPEESAAPVKNKERSKTTMLVIGLIAALAVIAVLVVLLVTGRTNNPSSTLEDPDTTQAGEETETEAVPTVSYSNRTDEEYDDALLDQVISTCGDYTLTNRSLAYYYWRELYSFQSYYSSYISYLLDLSAGLDTQMYDDTTTWEQYFLSSAISTFQTTAAACTAANAEGFTLTDNALASLDALEETLQSYAVQLGLKTAEEYLQLSYGPYCDLESYRAFMGQYLLASTYLASQLENQDVSDEALEAFYQENLTSYEEAGLEKSDVPMVNVRHILIQPDAVELTEEDEGYEEAVQAAKDAAKEKADELYAQWQAGDMTEDSFAALATENTQDAGSAQTGGLYESVYPGKTVEAFDAWCFAEGRETGDTDIVETSYGYHIMYYVGDTGESYWHSVVLSDYQNQLYSDICAGLIAAYPETTDLTNAAIYPCNVVQYASGE